MGGGVRGGASARARVLAGAAHARLAAQSAAAARQCAAGLATICLRAPAHPLARAVLARCGGALAAPSANRFGGVSPTGAAHVAADFADIEELLILDGGACANGIESTIVDLSGDSPALLRPGAITVARIEKTLGRTLAQGCAPAPGDRKKHYAPRAKIVVVAAADIESALARADGRAAVFSRARPRARARWRQMPTTAGSCEKIWYRTLRALDAGANGVIVVEEPPSGAAWRALRDRLARARG